MSARETAPAQAVLTTPRLELVPLNDDHLEHEVELDSDPEVMRYLWGRARTRTEVEADHQKRLALARQVGGLGLWAGFHRTEGPAEERSFVGLWMLMPPHGPSQPFVPGEADLGYRLHRRWWRQGLAKEGARELIRYGFDDLGLTRIFAQTMAVNVPSRATLASLGMIYVRSFPERYDEPVEGAGHGEVEYELRRTTRLSNDR